MKGKTIRYVLPDRSCTYSYRTGRTEGPVLGNHMHIYYEFVNMLDGNAIYNVEGHEYEFVSGDLMITNPNEFHFVSFPQENNYYRQFLQISSEFINTLRPHLLDTLDSRPFGENNRIPSEIVKKYRLNDIFLGIEECTSNVNENTEFMCRLYAAQLVIKLSEILQNEFLVSSSRQGNKHMKKIQNYIEDNFARDINLDSIAENVFLNKSYVSRLFKSETGLTISAYLNMRRIMLAKNLLMSGHNPGDIYYQCGFKDYSTFYRSFKKHVEMSPDDFKKSQI